ncbi:peptidyl-prolyl cis-trans isomerase, FKBP type [Skeletonema marinoi]|uniref:peptidylprolyl isomerase n=1 Tax=Skeletonema marinoi TaxID=267567 RepID=A0AAD9DC24_9STRA|nr:peptidyl-prolyl cis-trans isomerase, FKBP type [Skeletonema marinoi]
MHFISTILLLATSCDAFAPSTRLTSKSSTVLFASEEWIPLVTDDSSEASPVKKLVLEEGNGELPTDGSSVEIEYTGTLVGEKDWSAQDVADCWLSQLQGLDHLKAEFIQNNIDFALLSDTNVFTEEFCTTTLGISNKIQAKKLLMARNRLTKSQDEHPAGTVFDSSAERGKNFTFNLGKGAIKAIDLAVRSMRVGERASVVCRSDYGYGSEGLRSSKGDVMVPPFSTLNFELKRVC